MRYWHGFLILPFLVTPCLPQALASDQHVNHPQWTSKYDGHFRKYAKHYFGAGFDWHWFKAQGIAESGLRANAESPAGAQGIMQILPSTFEEIKEKNPHFTSLKEPRWNIAAAIFYDRKLYRRWKKEEVGNKKLALAFASYNAGYSKMRKAYRRATEKHRKVAKWAQLEPFIPGETARYVERIHRLMKREIH